MSNGDVYRDAQVGWVCPLCKRANAPWVRQCDCKEAINKWGEPIHVPAVWPDSTSGPLPKPVITYGSGGTAQTCGVVYCAAGETYADFDTLLERSLTENAAVLQALADYDKGADSE